MVRPHISLVAVVLAVVALAAPPVAAQTWTGLFNGSWNFGANWSPNALPVSGANTVLTFGGASAAAMTQDINTTFQLNNMHFLAGGPAYTLTGGGLQFVNTSGAIAPLIGFDTSSAVTLGNALTLGNNLTIAGSGSGALTLSGSVNSANGSLTYAGAGTFTLSGSSDNAGLGVTVSSGTVVLAKTSAPSPAVHAVGGGGLTVAGGTVRLGGTGGDQIFNSANVFITSGAFDTNGAGETFNSMNLQGTGIGGNGALLNNAAGTTSVLTPVVAMFLTGSASVGATATATLAINGPIVGSFGLTKVGAGTLTLGSGSNTYSGGTVVNGGTLALGTGTAIPTGSNVTVNIGGAFSTTGQGNTPATAAGTVTVLGGTFRVPSGAADYYLNGLAMGFSNPAGATLDFTGSTNAGLHFVNSGAAILAGFQTTWIGAGTSHIQNDTAAPVTIAVNNPLFSSVRLVNGTQGQGFQITGGGTFAPINIDNSATLTIDQSVLQVADLAAVGSGPLTLMNFGGILYTGPTATLSKSFTLGNGGGGLAAIAGAILTLSGNIGQSGAGGGLSVIGDPNLSGQGATVTLAGTNTYTGPTQVAFKGVLSIGSISDGGVAGPLGAASNSASNLVLGGNANLGASGYDGGGGTLRYTGPTASTDRGLTLADTNFLCAVDVTSAGTNLTASGKITGVGSLTKLGLGTLTITNITNNYAGGTFVNAGRLVLGDNDHILPAGGNVTIAAGAELDTGSPQSVADSNALGTLALKGGTFRNAAFIFFFNKITTDSNGGTITGGASAYQIDLLNAGAGITANGNTSITGSAGSFITSNNQPAIAISVAPGVTLTTNVSMFNFNLSGGGTMNVTGGASIQFSYVVSNAKLRIDDLTTGLQTDNLTLDAGTLQYGGPSVTLSRPFNLGAGGGTLEVLNAATTLTLTGTVSAIGPMTKAGPGVLALNTTANLFAGGITVVAGRLDVSNDAQLGLANPTVNALGTLRYTVNASTARTFVLNAGALEVPSGVMLTLNGAAVGGGFLRGAGTFAVTGGTTHSGTSTANSTTVNVTGPAAFANFSNSGVLAVAPGLSSPPSFANFINQGSGAMSVGAGTAVNVADFQSYGTLTLNPAIVGSGTFTELVNTGTSPLSFNGGSRTFIGTAATAGPPNNPNFVAGIDLHGQNALVAGGLFVNNGFIADGSAGGTATVIADFGALVKGAGYYQNTVVTQNGGKFQAGNSPGAVAFGRFVFGPGGVDNYVFAIDDAAGTAGPSPDAAGHVSGWGLVKAVQRSSSFSLSSSGDFTWTATPSAKLTVAIDTLINPTTVGTDVAGPMADFDPTQSYVWPAVKWTGTYSGPTVAATLNADTAFDTSGFVNPIAGTFGWALSDSSLSYTPTPVPEPGTLALLGAATAASWWRRRRVCGF